MNISPKEFLTTSRPEQFSDSEVISKPLIDSTVLEFYLDTLDTRSQEIEFERFGIRLCKAVITPNLLPNTGPSGGGDGKVDSETYPISEATALGWYTCIDPSAAHERWGFAFSIQKTWRQKIRDDVKKAFETGRNYKVVYYVSSRSIKAKAKGLMQDELREKYDIDVRILDRNWIIQQVFENKHQNIVREELHVEGITQVTVRQGPLDMQREEALAQLDEEIEDSISNNKTSLSTVDNAIQSAILSRELEKPRVEVDGRFTRAIRLAEKVGNTYQQFEAAYQLAWTTFWWHEDFSTYIELYQPVEDAVLNTEHVYNLERLTNLWYGLNHMRKEGNKLITDATFQQRTTALKDKLKDISKKYEETPNAALYARTLLLEIELIEKKDSKQSLDKTLSELKEVVIQSKNLVGFPFKPLIQVLTEVAGEALEDSPEYGDLFQTIINVTKERDGEVASARLSLNRAERLIDLNRPYEAIKCLSNSLRELHKYESRDDAVKALFLMGVAYEQVGLPWAARGSLLSAASLATSEFWNYGDINTMQAACYKHLKRLELQLGRVPQALDWHRLHSTILNALTTKEPKKDSSTTQADGFDMVLGVLFLRADLPTLKTLEFLPGTLNELGLEFSPVALIHALGCEDKLPIEFSTSIPSKERNSFFTEFVEKCPSEYLAQPITSTEPETIELVSHVLGCKIVVNTENKSPCVEVAESVLSSIESFLSTSILQHATAREPIVEINIDCTKTKALVEFETDDSMSRPIITIHCQDFNPHSVSKANQGKLKDVVFEILTHTISRFVSFKDHEDLADIIREERAPERSLDFTSSFVTLGNVLGNTPKMKISDFTDGQEQYELKRSEPLQYFIPTDEAAENTLPNNSGLFPEIHHRNIKTVSVVREPFWDKAKWLGVGYAIFPDAPPVLSILFTNIEDGKKIFSAWQEQFGKKDLNEIIRISIIQGVDENAPLHYTVGIGSNLELEKGTVRFVVSPTRRHTMTPQTSENLDRFQDAYAHFGCYLLAPGMMQPNGQPEILFQHGLIKKNINIKNAKEVSANDADIVLLKKTSNP